MKKIFILTLLLILCTGCIKINEEDSKNKIVEEVINNKVAPNTMGMGYKYYLPLGINKIYDKDYNQIFKFEDNLIYLYVDAVSYFYKNSLNFSEENTVNTYFYRKITNGNKTGFIKITKEKDNMYFIKIVYNYAKIESYVEESESTKVLTNSMIILNSLEYNDNLIKKILEDDYSLGAEKEYKIDKPKDTTSKFTEYLSEYVQNEETNISDLPEY